MRAQPFYCPYCGEQDFVPYGDEPSQFLCNSCARLYSVRFIAVGAPTGRPQGRD